jgi:ABC-2 type transport system permease protein
MSVWIRVRAIVLKEFRHIMRDWQTLMIVLLMPIVMMFLYGYALTLDVSELPVMVEVPVPTAETRSIVEAIDAATLFHVEEIVKVSRDPLELFRTRGIRALFRFSPTFASDLRNGGDAARVQVLIDGSDPNVGTLLKEAVGVVVQTAALRALNIEAPATITVDSHVLYNPHQRSSLYFVPGLMAIILLMISALLTSLTITREKELGTLEQLLVSPLRPVEIVIGKIVPYVALAATDGALILVVGWLAFGVAVKGSLLFLSLASLVYILTSLAIGLLCSMIARTQQQAMLMVLPLTVLPSIILSGFIFPVASLPSVLQWITRLVPATYFLEIVRGVMIKGIGPALLWPPLLVLLGIGVLLVAVSI